MNDQRINIHHEIGRRLAEVLVLSRFIEKHHEFLGKVSRLGVAENINAIYFDRRDLDAVTNHFGKTDWMPDDGDAVKEIDGVHVWIHHVGAAAVPFTFPSSNIEECKSSVLTI